MAKNLQDRREDRPDPHPPGPVVRAARWVSNARRSTGQPLAPIRLMGTWSPGTTGEQSRESPELVGRQRRIAPSARRPIAASLS